MIKLVKECQKEQNIIVFKKDKIISYQLLILYGQMKKKQDYYHINFMAFK